MNTPRWYAIHAGGRPRQALDRGVWMTPYFMNHDNCREWWENYCRQTRESSTWAITDQCITTSDSQGNAT